jgi:uncharacterized coiled-coil protein SlyX
MGKNTEVAEQAADNTQVVEELKAHIEELESMNEALQNEVDFLTQKLNSVTTKSASVRSVSATAAEFGLDGTRYAFTCGKFWYRGQKLQAADILENESLLRSLVEEFPGLVQAL